MSRIAIIGSGEFGQQVVNLIQTDSADVVIGYYDDFEQRGIKKADILVLGKINTLFEHYKQDKFDSILIAIGYKYLEFKEVLYKKIRDRNIPIHKFVHSSCIIDKSAILSEGIILFPGTVIDQNTVIEENVIININCTICHNTRICKNTFLAPAVAIASYTTIGPYSMLGIQSTVIDKITIASNTFLGAGTVVIKNLHISGVYVGNPARLLNKI